MSTETEIDAEALQLTRDMSLDELATAYVKLRAERHAAVENVLAIIDPWTRGAFTGWTGQSGLSKITLDEAEDHFSLCMVDMKNDVRTKLGAAAPVIATVREGGAT